LYHKIVILKIWYKSSICKNPLIGEHFICIVCIVKYLSSLKYLQEVVILCTY